MKPKTKQRIMLACLGGPLSLISGFVGGGLVVWGLHFSSRGMTFPEMFGWIGLFTVFGLIGLTAMAPALLVILVCGVAWRPSLRRHALLSTILPFLLGGVTTTLGCFFEDTSGLFLFSAVTICLSITIIVELFIRKRMQNNKMQNIGTNAPNSDL